MLFWTKFATKWYFWSKTEKNECHHWILHIRISQGTKVQFRVFWTKFAQNRYFWLKKEKVNITTEFWRFKLVYGPNFSLNWQFWFFGPNLPKIIISCLKQENRIFGWVHGCYLLQYIKGATKLYFMYYSCVVIILFSTRLYRSAFSTYAFGKTRFLCFCVLVFRVSVTLAFDFQICSLFWIQCLHKRLDKIL